jgi:hypothetical protein
MQYRHQEPGRKAATTSEEVEDIRQDLQEDRRVGDRKASSRVFDWVAGSERLILWRGRHTPKQKKRRPKNSLGKEDDGGTPGRASNSSGNNSRREALRRERREQLDSNHRENKRCGEERRGRSQTPQAHTSNKDGSTPVGYSGLIDLKRKHCGMLTHC